MLILLALIWAPVLTSVVMRAAAVRRDEFIGSFDRQRSAFERLHRTDVGSMSALALSSSPSERRRRVVSSLVAVTVVATTAGAAFSTMAAVVMLVAGADIGLVYFALLHHVRAQAPLRYL